MKKSILLFSVLLTTVLIYQCKEEKVPIEEHEISQINENEFVASSLQQEKDTLFLNLNPFSKRYQLCHIEARDVRPFVVLGKVEADMISKDSCMINKMTFLVQAFRGRNHYKIDKIEKDRRTSTSSKPNFHKFNITVGKVEETDVSEDTSGRNRQLIEFSVPINLVVDRKTVFDFNIGTSDVLASFLEEYYVDENAFTGFDAMVCCGAICKAQFVF